jgi:hypothetical protein
MQLSPRPGLAPKPHLQDRLMTIPLIFTGNAMAPPALTRGVNPVREAAFGGEGQHGGGVFFRADGQGQRDRGGFFERIVIHAQKGSFAHRAGHQRKADFGRHQREDRGDLWRRLAHDRLEPAPAAQGHGFIEQGRPEAARGDDQRVLRQIDQAHRVAGGTREEGSATISGSSSSG